MTVTDKGGEPGAATSAAALAAYNARIGRLRKRYYAVIGVVLLAVAVLVAVVWSGAEIRGVSDHPAAAPAPDVPTGTPGATLQQVWQVGEQTATGEAVYRGTVITFSEHTVSGRNVLTGAVVWSFTRRDVPVCNVVQVNGKAIALFRHSGNCDEVTALDSETGKRAWERTLFKDSRTGTGEGSSLMTGNPKISANDNTVLLVAPNVAYAIDPGSGLDRWVYPNPEICTTVGAVLGGEGTLIGQHCSDGDHLVLHDPFEGDDKKGVKWRVDSAAIPLSAGPVLSGLDPAKHVLQNFEVTSGKALSVLALQPAPSTANDVVAIQAARQQLIWVDGQLYVIDPTGTVQFWTAASPAPPAVISPTPGVIPDLLQAQLAIPSGSGIELLNGAAGTVARTISTGADLGGGEVHPAGNGFVVSGAKTTFLQ